VDQKVMRCRIIDTSYYIYVLPI